MNELGDVSSEIEKLLSPKYLKETGLFDYAQKLFSQINDRDFGGEGTVEISHISSLKEMFGANHRGYIITFRGEYKVGYSSSPWSEKTVLLLRLRHGSEYGGTVQECYASDDFWVAKMLDSLSLEDGSKPLIPPEMVIDEKNRRGYALFEFVEGPTLHNFKMSTEGFGRARIEEVAKDLGRVAALRVLLGRKRGTDDYIISNGFRQAGEKGSHVYGNVVRPIDLALGLYEGNLPYYYYGTFYGNDTEVQFLQNISGWDNASERMFMLKEFEDGVKEADKALINAKEKLVEIKREAFVGHPNLEGTFPTLKKEHADRIISLFGKYLDARAKRGSENFLKDMYAYWINSLEGDKLEHERFERHRENLKFWERFVGMNSWEAKKHIKNLDETERILTHYVSKDDLKVLA